MRVDHDYVFLPVNATDTGVLDVLDVLPGEAYRWLLPRSGTYKPGDALRLVDSSGTETVVGNLRTVRGERYTDLVLSVGELPTEYRQFALQVGDVPITETFYPNPSGYASRLAYMQAITRHLAAQPLLSVDIWRSGYAIYLRLHDSERLNLTEQAVTVGLGRVIDQNSNAPSLAVVLTGSEVKAPAWPYRVTVGNSVAAGNEYQFGEVKYTATEDDTALSVRKALGLPLDAQTAIELPSSTYPLALARTGDGRFANTNNPTLILRYVGNQEGQNRFAVMVGADIAEGNVYQISVAGQADRVVVATKDSTVSSITTGLIAGGVLSVPGGVEPQALTDPGYRTAANLNAPSLTLEALAPLPTRTVRHWSVYVGSDVQPGNTYELTVDGTTTSYTAKTGDAKAEVVAGLKQTAAGGGFAINTADGITVSGLARRGPAYQAPDHMAPIALTQQPRPVMAPLIAELKIPATLSGGFRLKVGSGISSVAFRISTATVVWHNETKYLTTMETSLLRWGGFDGLEDGLQCQLRLPVVLTQSRQQQSESLSVDLSGTERRGRAISRVSYQLTTKTASSQFHRSLWAALKSGRVRLDGREVEQLGDYSTSDGNAPLYRGQGRTMVYATQPLDSRVGWGQTGSYLSGSYALIRSLRGEGGLLLWVRSTTFEGQLREGEQLPAGEYELHVRTGADTQRLRIDGPEGLVGQYTLWALRSNRLRNLRLAPGEYSISLTPMADQVTATTPTVAYGDPEVTGAANAEQQEVSDFNGDFNEDYD